MIQLYVIDQNGYGKDMGFFSDAYEAAVFAQTRLGPGQGCMVRDLPNTDRMEKLSGADAPSCLP